MKVLRMLVVSVLLCMLCLCLVSSEVLATRFSGGEHFEVVSMIAAPDSVPTIDVVDIYKNVLVSNDQLVIGQYDVPYAAVPTETAAQSIILRYLDSTSVEVANTVPVVFNMTGYTGEKGYNHGVFSMYLEPVDAPTWNSAVSINLVGNPLLAWVPAAPNVLYNSVTWHATTVTGATRALLKSKILAYGATISTYWSVDLTTNPSAGQKLSTDGANYFTQVIPGLRLMVPELFADSSSTPEFTEKTYVGSFRTTLKNRWVGTTWETKFQNDAAAWHVSEDLVKAIYFFFPVFIVAFLIGLAVKDTKPSLALTVLTIPAGAYFGLLDLYVALAIGFMLLLVLGLTIWHGRASP